ncbi:(2Fe-2S) ferredoxin domain-containing protein [Trichormus azollae]
MSSNSQAVKYNLDASVKAAGLEKRLQVAGVGCMRLCYQGPLV